MWLQQHGLLNGGTSSEDNRNRGAGKGGWLHDHELLNRNTAEHSMEDLFKNNHVSMFDYFDKNSNPDVKMSGRSQYAMGGQVETMDTTPSWAQGAPANNAREPYARGGNVGAGGHSNSVFDTRDGKQRPQPMIEWTGYFGHEKC